MTVRVAFPLLPAASEAIAVQTLCVCTVTEGAVKVLPENVPPLVQVTVGPVVTATLSVAVSVEAPVMPDVTVSVAGEKETVGAVVSVGVGVGVGAKFPPPLEPPPQAAKRAAVKIPLALSRTLSFTESTSLINFTMLTFMVNIARRCNALLHCSLALKGSAFGGTNIFMFMRTFSKFPINACVLGAVLLLTACGGGSSSSSLGPSSPGPTSPSGPTWTSGVFAAESTFKDFCASPRSGTDPATGSAYPDQAGTTTQENFWLRSWSNRTYLWYDEITDQNPASFSNRLTYFDTLKTARTTASGNPVDKFHFTIPTDEYQQSVSSGAAVGYGARFRLIRSSPPREIVVAYVETGSPADAAGLKRGDQVLEIDGENAVSGANTATLNSGLFPENAGESHTFVIQSVGSTATRSVTLNSATVTSAPVLTSNVMARPGGGNVAYVLFNTFGTSIAEEALFDTFTALDGQGVTDLVLDLRYNGGGFLAISSELAYMIAGSTQTSGSIYETLVFNDKHPTTNPITGQTLSPTPFYSTAQGFSVAQGTPLPSLDLPRVFVLSTTGTCSASESLVNALRGINVEVVLIGTTTCGKPYGFYATDNCGETYFTIQFRGENEKGFGDYSDGFSPNQGGTVVGEPIAGCVVDDDYTKPLGDESEGLLSTALTYIDTGACPAGMSVPKTEKPWGAALDSDTSLSLMNDPRIQRQFLLETSRILSRPKDMGLQNAGRE